MKAVLTYNNSINKIHACIHHRECILECVRKKVFFVKMWWGEWIDGEPNQPFCRNRLKKENVIMSNYVKIQN
jgi:hypothetical protein